MFRFESENEVVYELEQEKEVCLECEEECNNNTPEYEDEEDEEHSMLECEKCFRFIPEGEEVFEQIDGVLTIFCPTCSKTVQG